MATVEVRNAVGQLVKLGGKIQLPKKSEKPRQERLFPMSDSERQEKIQKLLSTLDELEYLKAERKDFLAENKDQQDDAEKRIRVLREDLGLPETSLGPNALAARDEERSRHEEEA